MKTRLFPLALTAALATAACAGPAGTRTAAPAPASSQTAGSGVRQQAGFLQRLTGDWEYEAEALTGPDQPPVKLKGVEHGRMLGPWAVLELEGQTPTGRFTAILTVGPARGGSGYVGTWISSESDEMSTYQGQLDEAAGTLTLDSMGPDPADPSRQIRYRDVIRLVDAGHKEMTSMMELQGKWLTFVTARYRRQ